MRKVATAVLRLTVIVGIVAWLGASPAAAQHFSFGFSSGHHHHHHHHRRHWHDHCFEPWFGVLVAPPPPVIRERVIYVEPPPRVTTIVTGGSPLAADGSTASPLANSMPASPPAASTTAATAVSDARITIRNGAGVQLPVAFLVDGQDIELPDGQARSFVGRDRLRVQYDRGGHFGSTQQELVAGDYDFRITATGWDLVRRVAPPDRTAVRPNSLPAATAR